MLDIHRGALASLIVSTEAPRISMTLVVDNDGMISAGGCPDGIADVGNGCRLDDNADLACVVLDGGRIRYGRQIQTNLLAIDAAPDECFSVRGDGDGVVLTTSNMSDGVVLEVQSLHDLRSVDCGVIVTSAVRNTGAPKTIRTPAPDAVFRVNGKRVIVSNVNCLVSLQSRTKRRRVESILLVCAGTLHDMISKLVLLSATPGVNDTFVIDSHSMIGATGNIGNVLEIG